MGGYKRPRKVYKLDFVDDDMEGLEVRARGASTGELLTIARLIDSKSLDDVEELLTRFSEVLVDWNLEDEHDQPIPATLESLLAEDFPFVQRIVREWAEAVSGVSAPLEQPSPGGDQSLAASIPMAV